MVTADDNPVYGDYHNGPEYNIVEDNNLHYSDSVHGWDGGIVTDRNQHYEWTEIQIELENILWWF